MSSPSGYVYVFAVEGTDLVKIGTAKNVQQRLYAMQVSLPYTLRVYGMVWVENPVAVEQQLHQQYVDVHVRGEWFALPPERRAALLEMLNTLGGQHAPPVDPSQTDWTRDEDMNVSDIPEATPEDFARGVLMVDGKPVERGKQRVTLYLDRWVVEMFKAKAGDRGYQTLINEALIQARQQPDLEHLVRRIVREELQEARAEG